MPVPSRSIPKDEIISWLGLLSDELRGAHQRLVLSIEGDWAWCRELFLSVQSLYKDVLAISNRELGEQSVSFNRVETLHSAANRPVVVVDLFDGLNPDVLCIASGLASCGGLMILLSPGPQNWGTIKDQYGIWQDNLKSRHPVFAESLFSSLGHPSTGGITLTQGKKSSPDSEITQGTANPPDLG